MSKKSLPRWSGYGLAAGDVGSGYGKSAAAAPPAGATQWGIGFEDGGAGYAAVPTGPWTAYYTGDPGENVDWQGLGYGKDGSGDPRWVFVWTRASSPGEIRYTSDLSAGAGGYTAVNLPPPDSGLACVAWSNDVWVAGGDTGTAHLWRSTDGAATWAEIDLSGLVPSIVSGPDIHGIATDGSTNMMFAQRHSVYKSTDNGATWSLSVDFDDPPYSLTGTYRMKKVVYVKDADAWVVYYYKNGAKFRALANSDIADGTKWSIQFAGSTGGSVSSFPQIIAAGGETYVVGNGQNAQRFTVADAAPNPPVITSYAYVAPNLPHGNVRGVGTDGTGTWVCVHSGGDVSQSTDDGATWTSAATGVAIPPGTDDDIKTVAADVYLPV